jgi:hypothetical protein
MYKTLRSINDNRSILSNTHFTSDKCEKPETSAVNRYLETMFFAPLKVPEQGKYIQAENSDLGR